MYHKYLRISVNLWQKRKILSISDEHTATCAHKNHAVGPNTDAYAIFHYSSLSWATFSMLCIEAIGSGDLTYGVRKL